MPEPEQKKMPPKDEDKHGHHKGETTKGIPRTGHSDQHDKTMGADIRTGEKNKKTEKIPSRQAIRGGERETSGNSKTRSAKRRRPEKMRRGKHERPYRDPRRSR